MFQTFHLHFYIKELTWHKSPLVLSDFFSTEVCHNSYFYFLIFFCFSNIFNQKKIRHMVRLFIYYISTVYLLISSVNKNVSIILGLLLATILVGSRIQGQRKLEYIGFKNSLEFFSYLRIS